MKQFNIEKIYNAYCEFSKLQCKTVISQSYMKGMYLTIIEAYTYLEAPSCKHLFSFLRF